MTHQTESVTMWFDRRLVMRASPIHGIGTFATHSIQAGTRLIWVTGGIELAGRIRFSRILWLARSSMLTAAMILRLPTSLAGLFMKAWTLQA